MSFREQVTKRFGRSWGWGKVRKVHIKANPTCAACGRKDGLEVHHIIDYSTRPEMELAPLNLLTLCDKGTKCHFTFGHLGDWQSINPQVVADCRRFILKVKNRRKRGDADETA